MNGNALREPRDDDAVAWDWAIAQLHDEAHHISVAIDELEELGNPDPSASLTLWQLQLDGLSFVAQGLSDPAQRARFEAILRERRRVMDALLVRARMRRTS